MTPNQDQSLWSSEERFDVFFQDYIHLPDRGYEAWKAQDQFYQPIITKLQEEVESEKKRFEGMRWLFQESAQQIQKLTQELEGANEKLMSYEEVKNLFKNSRYMTSEEREFANKFFWSHFETPSVQDKEGKV